MTSNLFGRALGTISPQALQRAETSRLLSSLQAAPGIRFDGSDGSTPASAQRQDRNGDEEDGSGGVWAHKAGVNSLAIDKFEGRYMLSGGADSSILLWDLESAGDPLNRCVYNPTTAAKAGRRAPSSHKFGITHLSFYPFDSLAFLSTSYDHTLKIHATETQSPSASFDLNSIIYSHALSPIAHHLLVACATQHPAVRLVDLRSGASTHSLTGHRSGAVLSVAWSPRHEHILASAGSEGTVKLWDIRRSGGSLGVLDMDDSVGIGGDDGRGKNARARNNQGTAHVGACNGVVWTDDGRHLVTAGHDERVRVWDVGLGANALSHFGPRVKNTHLSPLLPLLPPRHVSSAQVMIYPNEKELLMFDLFEGTLLKRLAVPVAQRAGGGKSAAGGGRNVRNDRITSLAWRSGDVEVYSAHSDGRIRAWKAKMKVEMEIEREEEREREGCDEDEDEDDDEDGSRKRKRKALDDVFRDLTRRKITFI